MARPQGAAARHAASQAQRPRGPARPRAPAAVAENGGPAAAAPPHGPTQPHTMAACATAHAAEAAGQGAPSATNTGAGHRARSPATRRAAKKAASPAAEDGGPAPRILDVVIQDGQPMFTVPAWPRAPTPSGRWRRNRLARRRQPSAQGSLPHAGASPAHCIAETRTKGPGPATRGTQVGATPETLRKLTRHNGQHIGPSAAALRHASVGTCGGWPRSRGIDIICLSTITAGMSEACPPQY